MAGDDDYEHWPDDNQYLTQPAAPKAPEPTPPPPAHFLQQPQPQPFYYAQPPMTYGQPQYYSHPPQYYQYTYAPPAPAPAPAPAAPAPVMAPANQHVYYPSGTEPKPGTGQPSNVWVGRTKEEVEEDNMKIAKKQGAYDKRKMAPVDVKDDQYFWVVELDGKTTLR